MANQERLNLDESIGLNRNLDIGSASGTVQLMNEINKNEAASSAKVLTVSNGSSKKNKCLSSNKNDETTLSPFSAHNGSKPNASNDVLKSSKTFGSKEAGADADGNEVIQMKNLKIKSPTLATSIAHQIVDSNQIKINLIEDEKKSKKEKKTSEANLSDSGKQNNNRKKFFEFNFSKINRKTLKRPLPCLFAWSLLIATTGAYFAMVSPKLFDILEQNYFYWISVVGVQFIIFLYVIVNFLIATLRDPGRFPKVVISPDDPTFNDDTKSPLYKSITIKKTQVKIKWCSVS